MSLSQVAVVTNLLLSQQKNALFMAVGLGPLGAESAEGFSIGKLDMSNESIAGACACLHSAIASKGVCGECEKGAA